MDNAGANVHACAITEGDVNGDKKRGNTGQPACSLAEVRCGLNKAAANLNACGRVARDAASRILQSCEIAGSKGAACKGLLLAKVNSLIKLAAMCRMATKHLSCVMAHPNDEEAQNDLLIGLLDVSRFMNDQLQSEQRAANNLLGMLRDSQLWGRAEPSLLSESGGELN